MPRKKLRVAPPERLDGWVDTYEELGEQLGDGKPIHRNTLSAWARMRGAPKGPPYSVIEWYTFARAQGFKVAKPRNERIRALIDATERNPEVDLPALDDDTNADGTLKLPGEPTPYDGLVIRNKISFSTAREREQLRADMITVQQRTVTLETQRLEAEKAKGTLIPKDESTKASAIVFNAFIREGELLPEAVVQALPELQHSVKAQVSEAVKAAWSAALDRVGKEAPDARG